MFSHNPGSASNLPSEAEIVYNSTNGMHQRKEENCSPIQNLSSNPESKRLCQTNFPHQSDSSQNVSNELESFNNTKL